MNPPRRAICVLITCHNRRDLTLRSLEHVMSEESRLAEVSINLVDDGSCDGTVEAVRCRFPTVNIIAGGGNLYWSGGMRLAWQEALRLGPFEFYLWLNDDLDLHKGWLDNILAFHDRVSGGGSCKVIAVGKVVDPDDLTKTTYGGYVRSGWLSMLSYRLLRRGENSCDTMNGNCVLIPAMAVNDIGIISRHYTHGGGDIDYGLRARRAGYKICQTDEAVGEQYFNENFHQKNARLSLKNWRFIFFDPKGVPWREWLYFCRTYGGALWPINFVLRYLRMLSVR
jgi:GT2 family glycosyltransferase